MEFEMEGRAAPLEGIKRGRLCLVLSSNVTTLAIKGWRRDAGGTETDCFGLLGPFPEDTTISTPCVRVAQSMTLDHIAELPDARIVPNLELGQVHLGWDDNRTAGWLATIKDDLFMVLAAGGGHALIDLKTGEIIQQFRDRPGALAWFSQWSIAVPRLGKFIEIHHFNGVPPRTT